MKFNSLIPELTVLDIKRTKHFYVDVLNFKNSFCVKSSYEVINIRNELK